MASEVFGIGGYKGAANERYIRNKAVISEYLQRYYYPYFENMFNDISYEISETESLKMQGIDVKRIIHDSEGDIVHYIEEMPQLDSISRTRGPLNAFYIELYNSATNEIGWYFDTESKSQYYLFVWPHTKEQFYTVDDITYAHFALVDKKILQRFLLEIYELDSEKLYDKAVELTEEPRGTKVRTGYKYTDLPFDADVYLYFKTAKSNRPVYLVMNRDLLFDLSEHCGTIANGEMDLMKPKY
ncbi:MAG: hypothetical protein K6E10_05140 [Eubacterium sp.]|nr:hypothetical protein [Eubacterium sp.]